MEFSQKWEKTSKWHRQTGQEGARAESYGAERTAGLRSIHQRGFYSARVTLFVKGFLRGPLR